MAKASVCDMHTERLLTGDTKVTFTQAALDIGIYTVENFNKVPADITKHAFPAYDICEQKKYQCRYLIKSRPWNYVTSSVGSKS